MVSKSIFSIGLCIVLFVFTTNSTPISSTETVIALCIKNITETNCTQCNTDTFQSNPDNPSMFYHCSANGILYPNFCSPNTVWNQDSESLDIVSCIENINEVNCIQCTLGTLQPNPNDPSKYYNCSTNGILYPKSCDPNFVWDQDTESCIIEDFSFGKTCIVNITDANCTKCIQGSYEPYPDDTTMFYQCNTDGQLYPQHCLNDTVWNQTIHTCVHEDIPVTTNQYDSDSVTPTIPSTVNDTTYVPTTSPIMSSTAIITETVFPSSTTIPHSTTPAPHSFDGGSFGGGIAAGLGLALIILLLIRCCCSTSPSREGYQQHV